jgi:bifunctional non-homologous end joining protein LigD
MGIEGRLSAAGTGEPIMSQFVVHEHRSMQTHFDLRLEIDGVLKSWAVPKGPSMNPADKRLAIQVADHPLAYLRFHGVIPQGLPGAGRVAIWDTGRAYFVGDESPAAAIKAGKLLFVLHGSKLHGGFALVRRSGGADNEWLLVKRCDRHAVRGSDRNYAREIFSSNFRSPVAMARKRRDTMP